MGSTGKAILSIAALIDVTKCAATRSTLLSLVPRLVKYGERCKHVSRKIIFVLGRAGTERVRGVSDEGGFAF